MNKYIPKCPRCGSTNVKEISHFSRGFTQGLFLPFTVNKLFSSVGKTWHCKNCGQDF